MKKADKELMKVSVSHIANQDYVKQGKKNRAKGSEFERKVRKDLESLGWIVAKWSNNVENGKLIPAKHKFNPFKKIMSTGTGFPDFMIFKRWICNECTKPCGYTVLGVEVKSNGYLDKEEKKKLDWLLDNEVFSDIFIAKKGMKGEIIYSLYKQKTKEE